MPLPPLPPGQSRVPGLGGAIATVPRQDTEKRVALGTAGGVIESRLQEWPQMNSGGVQRGKVADGARS